MSDSLANLRRQLGNTRDLGAVVKTMKAMSAASISQFEQAVAALEETDESVAYASGMAALSAVRHDRILREFTTPPADLAAWNVRTTDRIRSRAAELSRRRPELAPVLEAYVARQEEECAYLDEHFVGATWLLRRAP